MISAIVLAAGMGTRMNTEISKQYLNIAEKPMLYHSIKAFDSHSDIDEIVVVIRKGEEEIFEREVFSQYRFVKNIKIVRGGSSRSESVKNGLDLVDAVSDIVLIHDGVRPFIDKGIIDENIAVCRETGACITAVSAKDTIKLVDDSMNITETVPRDKVYLAQTPQTFKSATIKRAFENSPNLNESITDDSLLVEKLGIKVKIARGSYENIKITTPEDIAVAEEIAKKRGM